MIRNTGQAFSRGLGAVGRQLRQTVSESALRRGGSRLAIAARRRFSQSELQPRRSRAGREQGAVERFNKNALVERWVDKYQDPVLVKKALSRVRAKDQRYQRGHATEKMNAELGSVQTQLDEKISASESPRTRTASLGQRIFGRGAKLSESAKEKKLAKIETQIKDDLVGLLERADVQVSFTVRQEEELTLTQVQGRLTSDGELVSTTLSAEKQSKEAGVKELANLGFIKASDGSVVCTRSSRSETESRVQEKSAMDIHGRLTAFEEAEADKSLANLRSDPNGLHLKLEEMQEEGKIPPGLKYVGLDPKTSQPKFEYQRVDVSFMDRSRLKAVGTTLKSIGKPPENERAFLNSKESSVENLFRDGNLQRTVEFLGVQCTVEEKKPIVLNHVFSAQANSTFVTGLGGSTHVEVAAARNTQGTLQLLQPTLRRLSEKLVNEQASAEGERINVLRDSIGACSSAISTIDELQGREPFTLDQNECNALAKKLEDSALAFVSAQGGEEEKIATVLNQMAILLRGEKPFGGGPVDDGFGSLLQFTTTVMLTDLAGAALSVECKSGNDRTATGVALSCAMKEFEEVTGRPYNPLHATKEEEGQFAQLFVKYIQDFGRPNVMASRGAEVDGDPVIKVKTSPVFLRIIDQLPEGNPLRDVENWSKKAPEGKGLILK